MKAGQYECLVLGGGIAGLQAAIQLGRYGHRTLVVDKGTGRSALCRSYHNLLGWPAGVAGPELRRIGREQAERLGVVFADDEAVEAGRLPGGGFYLATKQGQRYEGACLLFATGIADRFPAEIEGLQSCLGISIYVCPDCDGHEIGSRHALVLGAGNAAAAMAVTLGFYTERLAIVNHEPQRGIKPEWVERLEHLHIAVIDGPIRRIIADDGGSMSAVELQDGRTVSAERAFTAFGGNQVQTDLAHGLGVERMENRHLVVDPRSKMTNVPGIWAAGDVGVHSEQAAIAMGEGAQAAIWMHKWLIADTPYA